MRRKKGNIFFKESPHRPFQTSTDSNKKLIAFIETPAQIFAIYSRIVTKIL